MLESKDWQEWAAYIRPAAAELRWQEIPWHTTFYAAVREAQRREMPILLWAMNGHPLSGT